MVLYVYGFCDECKKNRIINSNIHYIHCITPHRDVIHKIYISCDCKIIQYCLFSPNSFTFIKNLEIFYPDDFGIGKKYDNIHKIFPENAFIR